MIWPFSILDAGLGPYTLDFTPSGRYMAIAGRKGHIGLLDVKNMDLLKEFQVSFGLADIEVSRFVIAMDSIVTLIS